MDPTPNTTRDILLPLLLSVSMAAGMMIGVRLQGAGPIVEVVRYQDTLGHYPVDGKIEELVRYIDARYVDALGRDSLIGDAISSLVGHLDPHSSYLDPEEVRKLQETRDGEFTGIGVEFLIDEDSLFILRVLDDSPAKEKGLHPGDILLTVNDSLLSGSAMTPGRAKALLNGEQGSRLRMKVMRKGTGLIDLSMRRASIRVPSVSPGLPLDSTTGYIRIHRFGANTYREFMESLESLVKSHQTRDLVIDLRDNPGGFLVESVNILSQLFPDKDRLLVYTVGRDQDKREYRSIGRRFFDVDRLVLLVDENSASASEIMAGAVQDWDRGLIAGRRTFGKGLVQEQYGLRDGSAIVLTTARYYTPSGRSIQRDYSDRQAYAANQRSDRVSGQAGHESPRVFSTYNGRTVFEGGGIDPDVRFPKDTLLAAGLLGAVQSRIPHFQLTEIRKGQAGPHQITDPDQVMARFMAWLSGEDPGLAARLKAPEFRAPVRWHVLSELARYQDGPEGKARQDVALDPDIRRGLSLIHDEAAFRGL